MNKYRYVLVMTALLINPLYGFKVPKQISLALTGDYSSSTDYSWSPLGIGFSLDYAWMLAGIGKDRPHYLSVPLLFTWSPADSGGHPGHMLLRYGWSTRHYLTPPRAGGFYLGYHLFLNQLWIEGIPGKVLGHETILSLGYDLPHDGDWNVYVQLNGRYASFGNLGEEDSNRYYGIEVLLGMRKMHVRGQVQ